MEYNFREVEKKWQDYWASRKTFKTGENPDKPKYYVLDMFPYPSGAGLHVGHPLGYIASDIVARYKRITGFNVLHPMGYDSFGLPAEQYAIQTGQHPKITTKQNIARYREQMDKIGFSFDWDREVRTSEPDYYKWTQWIFIQIYHSWYNRKTNKAEPIQTLCAEFEKQGNTQVEAVNEETKSFTAAEWKGFSEKQQQEILMNYRLAYLSEAWVNWCPQLGTVLANDEVKDGVSERGGYPVERKRMPQWSMRITAYAERLLNDLEALDWSESIKESQRNWIGKSEGTSLRFALSTDLSPSPSPEERGATDDFDTVKNLTGTSPKERRVSDDDVPGYITTDPDNYRKLHDKALEMRKNPTPAEETLWTLLRRDQAGNHFRRQHIIGPFIVDFVCLEKRLIIEADGGIHDTRKEEDERRNLYFQDEGYQVLRFRNEEILHQKETVFTKIEEVLANSDRNFPGTKHKGSPPSWGGAGGEVRASIEVFTTRPDTVFGVSFLTLAPEHELVAQLTTPSRKEAVEAYITYAKNRSERERQADVKKITGEFTGGYVLHPFTGAQIPVWIGDYVLAGYGTGAVMAVPAHDSRDYAFAKHFQLPIPEVVSGGDISTESYDAKEGKLINSDFLNGMEVKAAIKHIIAEIEKRGLGKGKTNYRLRDAAFGRQRYWGEPIPVYYKEGIPYTLKEEELPLILPEIESFLPTETGEPPLGRAKDWKHQGQYSYELTTMPGWAGSSWYYLRYMDPHNTTEFASRKAMDYWGNVDLYIGGSEHATGHLLYVRFWTKFLYDIGKVPVIEPAKKLINQGMIQGSSCFVHRLDAINAFVSDGLIEKSLDQQSNTGGSTLFLKQLLAQNNFSQADIAAFENKPTVSKLHADVNIVSNNELDTEKFKVWREEFRTARFILEDGKYICASEVEKMSKSKHNVVSPDLICTQYGADCLRLYEMFLGPLEQSKPWNTNGITGVSGFIRKLWRLFHTGAGETFAVSDQPATKPELKALHKTIKKVSDDIERYSFNTSVSNFMICVNELTELKCNKRMVLEPLVVLVSPYAPHIAEELWALLGHTESITFAEFPKYEEKHTLETAFNYPVSLNGKTKFFLELDLSLTKEDIEKEVLALDQTLKMLEGKAPKKVIVVPNKIVNIVV